MIESKFKIFEHSCEFKPSSIHDLIAIDSKWAIVFTLSMPLEDKDHPAFLYSLADHHFIPLKENFIHARNIVSDFFFKNHRGLIVFDHGLDQSPFLGATPKFFRRMGDDFLRDEASFNFPKSFNFGGFSGDFDGDGLAELFVCSLAPKTSHFFANNNNQLTSADERLPELLRQEYFKVLAGCAFLDSNGLLHMACGSCGFDQYAANDLVFKNTKKGTFSNGDLIHLPPRRGGPNWACIEMIPLTSKHGGHDLLVNYHDPETQNGLLDIYCQKSPLFFEHFKKDRALYEEKDCWFPRVITTKRGDIIAIKGRGLKNYVKKDLNVVFLKKEKNTYVDYSHELIALSHKEFVGVAEIDHSNGRSHFLLMDYEGKTYSCLEL